MRDFDSLNPPPDLWDRALARAESTDPLVDTAGGRRRRDAWLAAAAVVVAVAASTLAVHHDDDLRVSSGSSPAADLSCPLPRDAGIDFVVDAPDHATGASGAFAVDVTVRPDTAPAADHVGLPASLTVDDAGASAQMNVGHGGCGSFVVAVRGTDTDGASALALDLAGQMLRSAQAAPDPLGCPLPADRELVVDRPGHAAGMVDGHRVTVDVPMPEARPLAGPEPVVVDVNGQPATITELQGLVDVEVQPDTVACPSFAVEVFGDDTAANRTLALAIATEMADLLDLPTTTATTIATNQSDVCGGVEVAAVVDGQTYYPADGTIAVGDVDVRYSLSDVEIAPPAGISATRSTEIDVDRAPCYVQLAAFGDDVSTLEAVESGLFTVDRDNHTHLDADGALWPTTSSRELFPGPVPLLPFEDPNQTALAFASTVLGWDDATVEPAEPEQQPEHGLGLALVHDGLRLRLIVDRVIGGRWWAVISVGYDIEGYGNITVSGLAVEAHCPGEGPGTTVRLDYAGRVIEGAFGEATTLPFDPDTDGSWLVLVRDEPGGPVVTACGGPLQPGDFAAG